MLVLHGVPLNPCGNSSTHFLRYITATCSEFSFAISYRFSKSETTSIITESSKNPPVNSLAVFRCFTYAPYLFAK